MGAKVEKILNTSLTSERGMAILETLPLLVVFVVLVSHALGMWGAIHTGILHSIAARTYAFETFRNRTSLFYFRENGRSNSRDLQHYLKDGFRYHGIQSSRATENMFIASQRPISLGSGGQGEGTASSEEHNTNIHTLSGRNPRGSGVGANPVWIMVGYGICLTPSCGGDIE